MKLEPIIQSEASQKEKHQYSILTHIYMEFDWNAKVGSQETPGIIGKFGLGVWNE